MHPGVAPVKRMQPHEALVGYKVRRWGRWRVVKAVTLDADGRVRVEFADGKVAKRAPVQPDLFNDSGMS